MIPLRGGLSPQVAHCFSSLEVYMPSCWQHCPAAHSPGRFWHVQDRRCHLDCWRHQKIRGGKSLVQLSVRGVRFKVLHRAWHCPPDTHTDFRSCHVPSQTGCEHRFFRRSQRLSLARSASARSARSKKYGSRSARFL